ncbi:hypothetical protein H5154_06145 [Pseudoalteromonas sp. SR44-5]|uniref:hypothetical protein n=1 Tax=Pseudoalteromonas sp. SR44-5 TaxID=2760934 RepID=UPI0016018D3D|nr:hypothetical protein [Pseudoalteromonas sp. SR44-5]MBB1365974.1 hypothetical protein [Pseudoalteromonas sp. SR44-5]
MNKSENTLLRLEAALQRILKGATRRISESRKLSVRAVEEEADIGNGSCYYYPDFVSKIQSEIAVLKGKTFNEVTLSDLAICQAKMNKEKKIKIRYRDKASELKQQVKSMAAEHHQLSYALRNMHQRVEELELQIRNIEKNKTIKIK